MADPSTSTIQPNETSPQTVNSQYPLLDSDPHFSRVVRYFRPTDYATIAAGTAGFPTLLYLWDQVSPLKLPSLKTNFRYYGFGTWLGFAGSFLYAYQQSSFRFWGWKENEREQQLQDAEFTALARAGKPIWGHSDQPAWIQRAAYRNSQFAQLKFSALPWFNVVEHPYHGVDVSKYYADAKVWRQEHGLEEQL